MFFFLFVFYVEEWILDVLSKHSQLWLVTSATVLALFSPCSSLFASLLSLVAIPVYVKQNINFFETGPCGRLDITIGPKQTMGKTVEDLKVTIPMPKSVLSANLTASQGNYTYDLASKVTVWGAVFGTFCHIYIIKSQNVLNGIMS